MDRLAEVFSLEIPQGHVDGRHRSDRHRRAAEIDRSRQHLLPKPLGFERVFADQQFAQPTRNVVAERRVHDGLDDFGEESASPIPSVPSSARTRTKTASWQLAVFAATLPTRSTWQMTCVIFIVASRASEPETFYSAVRGDFTPIHITAPTIDTAPATIRLARQPTDVP